MNSPRADLLRLKLGEAVRDLMLRDEPDNTARAIGSFVDLLRSMPPFQHAEANRWRRAILDLMEPTEAERNLSHPAGTVGLRALRLSREDKNALRTAIWELHGYLVADAAPLSGRYASR